MIASGQAEERLGAEWAVCRFPASRNSVDTVPAELPVAPAASADAARAIVAACASAKTPFESAARISATPGTPRSARRCAAADFADASAGTLSAPSSANADSARRGRV